jgi:hypothetical protein
MPYPKNLRDEAAAEGKGLFTLEIDGRNVDGIKLCMTIQGPADSETCSKLFGMFEEFKEWSKARKKATK